METSTSSKLHEWKPLLDEQHSQAARASLNEIVAVLKSAVESGQYPGNSAPLEVEVGDGYASLAVFFAYAERAGFFPGARNLISQSVEKAVDALASKPMGPSLFGGFTGIAWAVQHVSTLLGGSAEDFSEIDNAVEIYVGRSPWKDEYDLISGLVGLGVYCLERPESPVARHCLELIVDRLDELAEKSGAGICWFTPPASVPDTQKKSYPEGYYNVGVAHGVPGIIAVLGRTYAAGIAREKALGVLDGAVRWLQKQYLPASVKSSFPAFVVPDGRVEDCRVAWCYGDAGIAAALMLAARSTGNKDWEEEALAVARRAAARDPETSGVVDVCICHGSAGLAHIFNRFFQATQEPIFAEEARYWLQRTLEFRKPGTGAAGYSVYTGDSQGNRLVTGRLGLIEGIAGVGLMFLAAITDIEPLWDRIFLMDIPRQ